MEKGFFLPPPQNRGILPPPTPDPKKDKYSVIICKKKFKPRLIILFLKVLVKYIRDFGQHIRGFRQNIKGFGQNVKGFGQNLQYFDQNL